MKVKYASGYMLNSYFIASKIRSQCGKIAWFELIIEEDAGTMTTTAKTNWRIAGDAINNCNCALLCFCQFNALPTYGNYESLSGWHIRKNYFGNTRLDSVRFAWTCF
jgi:hypothetical protein